MQFGVLLQLLWIAPAFAVASEVTLDQAFQNALGKNESVAIAQKKIEQADAVVSETRGGIFPKLTGNVDYTVQEVPVNPLTAQFSPREQTTVGIGLEQPVFRGFAEFAVLNQRRRLRDAETAALDKTKQQLFIDLADQYLKIVSFEQDLVNLKQLLVILDRRASLLEARLKRGESPANESLSAQAQYASLEAEMALVESDLATAREKFSLVSALPSESVLKDPGTTIIRADVPPLDKLLARAEDRPDIREAIAKEQAADELVAAAWRAHSPKIDLTADYFFLRPGLLQDIHWQIGIKARIPLFEGGVTQAKVSQSVAMRATEQLTVAKLRRQAAEEIRSAHRQVLARATHLEKLKRAADISERNAKILERDFRRGLTRSIDVQLGLSDLITTKRGYDKARFTAQLEWYKLLAASASLPQTNN